MERALLTLIWLSPFVRLGIFFPLGAWIVFFSHSKIRRACFHSILLQVAAFALYYSFELVYYLQLNLEETIFPSNESLELNTLLIVYSTGLIFLLLNTIFIRFQIKKKSPKLPRCLQKDPYNSFSKSFMDWGLAILLSLVLMALSEFIFPPQIGSYHLTGLIKEKSILFYFSLFMIFEWKKKSKTFFLLRGLYSYLVKSGFHRKKFLYLLTKQSPPGSNLLHNMYKYSFQRDQILPGWGHIFVGDKWVGFPILFIFLLSLFLFLTAFFSYQSPILGIQYLNSWGLKPGIPDKDFFIKASNLLYLFTFLLIALLTYIYSKYLLQRYFHNLRLSQSPEKKGFLGYLPHSVLAHLAFFTILFIIPFSLQRKKPSEEKKNQQARHYQPDRLEFYFIDPNIPDEVKDLNGGVITGTETPNKEEGEKIADVKEADVGPKSGYIKRIKGKKVPPTYSNYISAKMRGPESYLDYWRRAPYPYSCVVAYTITGDGYIEDIELIEGSMYPDQDLLTLELIESLSPLMPPPTNGKSIRVTELFWNGSLDPASMPTPLQSEMVTHFDGRYMEELD